MRKTNLVLSLLMMFTLPLPANNIAVGTVTITDQNTTLDYTHIQFDISWDNSWRTSSAPNNWDAAWVFAKYKETGGDWKHATINYVDGTAVNDGHTEPSGSTITTPSDGRGVFIYSDAVEVSGNVSYPGAKLRWNYGTDGVADDATVDVKVFAIEMVNVPQGNFYLGDGSSDGTFRQIGSNTPVQITTNGVVVKCEDTSYDYAQLEGAGILVGGYDGIDEDGTTTISNADYPTGYKAFYCMKYEISQGQYVDFLNTLTDDQDTTRYMTETNYRHGTWGGSAGSRTTTTPDRACNYLSWADGAAYSDWAGLRPMTELEFEKACRGTLVAVANEYAWGTATVCPDASLTISGTEDGTETITTDVSAGACLYGYNTHSGGDGGTGPLRCGIFATGSTSTRVEAGASYYGIMEMSGNLFERPVTLGNTDGRAFTGLNGDGELTTDGNADVICWPGTDASGSGIRGGYWGPGATYLRVSDRYYAAGTFDNRHGNYGFRAVRTQ
jgi:formylglycine-generating enzyme required for sulfatase activity